MDQTVRDRLEAEERLRILAGIVAWSCDAIFTERLDGTILTWNGGAEELFGYTEEEVVGRPGTILVPPERAAEAEMLCSCAVRGQRLPAHQTVRLCKNGAPVEVTLAVSPLRDEAGELIGLSTIARDNAEQRWMAKALDDLISKLEVAVAEAQQSEDRFRRFLADAAHQLRSPMAGIKVCADAALRQAGPEGEASQLLALVVQESSRAARLVSSLLQMARLQQREGFAAEPCDIVGTCDAAVRRADSLAPGLEVRLEAGVLSEALPVLDGHAVGEMLANLLDNAVRHAQSRVDVIIQQDGDFLELRVVDDGPGMSDEIAERAFDRFASLDGKGGSGLGLPIAREVARAHGGELTYEGRERGFVARLQVNLPASRSVPHGRTRNGASS